MVSIVKILYASIFILQILCEEILSSCFYTVALNFVKLACYKN